VVTGAIVFAVVMVVVIPPLIMFAGAVWSAVFGWLSSEDAHGRGGAEPATDA
jgi:hypothetical protein